ncbi:MAG: glycoside hydrolase family 2 protein [Lachnospiraceae bacterium]|nr:glycoside hydrolase family 2 protein [Lachnospiraceae bacterium]
MEKIYLDRYWKFNEVFTEDMISAPMTGGVDVTVPHTVKEVPFNYFDESEYQMISCYQRNLAAPEEWRGKKVLITFDAVGHQSDVYLNGRHLYTHQCGYTAFTIDISAELNYGADNLLSVRVDSREDIDQPPFGFVIDYMTFGGIYRDVYLTVKEPVYMRDVFLMPRVASGFTTVRKSEDEIKSMMVHGELDTAITLSDEGKKAAAERRLTVRQLLDDREISAQPLDENGLTKTLCGEVGLWDVLSPQRYTLTTELIMDGEVVDVDVTTIGFRTAVFKKEAFYLNGRPLKLRGLNRHQSYPYIGYAATESLQRHDAYICKHELGLNAVRTSHYPQSHYFLDECDRLGLLVFTEIPGWQHIGGDAWKDIAVKNTLDMVVQYRNHPSIMLWGVRINESPDDDDFYRRTNDMAHRMDPTRQTGGVRCNKKMSFLEDVYTYNDFSHSGQNDGCEPKKNVTPDVERPYFISEYNGHMYPTKTFDWEEHRMEHFMRHARVLESVASYSDICGSFGWCMFDYNTHKDFGSGDRICYHGVMDMFRNPKMAASIYAAQSDENDVLEVTSTMDIGEHPASVRGETFFISNADTVRMYKNNVLIKEYSTYSREFPHLMHGPVAIDDLIGDEMMKNEGFSRKQNELVKICLNETAIHGYNITPKIAWAAFRLMLFHGMKPDEAVELFQKYIGDWGGESKSYRFDAVKDGKVVKSVVKSAMTRVQLGVDVSARELFEDQTYDMAAVRIVAADEYKNILPYFSEAVRLSATGPIEIVGPDVVPMRGGMCGTYVRTTGSEGEATLIIECEGTAPVTINFNVSKK